MWVEGLWQIIPRSDLKYQYQTHLDMNKTLDLGQIRLQNLKKNIHYSYQEHP